MRIGLDISALQGPHRMRGIGYVVHHFLQNLESGNDTAYVFYILKKEDTSLKNVLSDLEERGITFEIRHIQEHDDSARKELPGKLKYVSKALKKASELSAYRSGDARIQQTNDLDAFIQLDQSPPLPKLKKGAVSCFIAYDLIPYVLESEYLWNYHTARTRGLSRKASLKCSARRWLYIKKLRLNAQRAHVILAISETTRQDYIRYVGSFCQSKIRTVLLGVDKPMAGDNKARDDLRRYIETAWGYIPLKTSLTGKRYILFVGGADHRRRLDDLVTAFNHLRAQGHDYKLVLSGDIMQGPRNIPTERIQQALVDSAYQEDIYYLGFTDDQTRNWLYNHAHAFIFPSVYEGFGLPILEAMSYGTPVIAYKNSAIYEVAGDNPFYASDALSMADRIVGLESLEREDAEARIKRAQATANEYSWKSTVTNIMKTIKETVNEK